jgi:excisionase family DNA binding protein
MSKLLTVKELAELVRRRPKTINDWIGAGKIPHIKLPTGGVLFDPDEIDKWLAQYAVPVAVPDRKYSPKNLKCLSRVG